MRNNAIRFVTGLVILTALFIYSDDAFAGLLFNSRDAAPDVEVKIEKDPSSDVSGYRTYSWIPGVEKRVLDPRLRDSELDQRVREYVDRELQARGYQKTNFGNPDFWVGYYAVIETTVDTETVRTHIGGPTTRDVMRGTNWPRETEIQLQRSYDQGTLVLDMVDSDENKLVWRASAKAEVHQKAAPETRRSRLSGAVSKMLSSLPESRANERVHEEIYRMQEAQDAIRETREERRDSR